MNDYKLTYKEGYSDNILMRCVDLMATENEADLLENNFPG